MDHAIPAGAPVDPLQVPQATDDNGERSIDVIVSTRADLAIERLARRHRISRRDVIERLVLAADERIIARMDIDSDDWVRYFGVPAIQP